MTSTEKIIALANLDGCSCDTNGCWMDKNEKYFQFGSPPNYLTSYDAIIPLIQKQLSETKFKIAEFVNWNFNATPTDLCDALLKAKGLL